MDCSALRLAWPALALLLAGTLAACSGNTSETAPPATPTPQPTPTANVVVELVTSAAEAQPSATPFDFPQAIGIGGHLSSSGSYTQTETEAAGPMVCRIPRDSCAFRLLVSDRDPAILFSESEPPPYGAEDRLMHPAMTGPLTNLAALVAAEWGQGVQLMVTEAYDSLLQHNNNLPNPSLRYSLHFEGRSVDLITWPPDITRNGRLCVLALEAGFTWVHNEDDHCHASIKAPSLCGCNVAVTP